MNANININEIFKTYIHSRPEESAALAQFAVFISKFSGKDLFDRKNFEGHITASAMIINARDSTLLFIKHKGLDRWLQPGGHVDEDDESVLAAALREVNEETGIKPQNLNPLSHATDEQMPFDIDTHLIPAKLSKNEPEHYHHDFRFLFIYKGDNDIVFNIQEAMGVKWETLEIAGRDSGFNRSIGKIRAFIGRGVPSREFLKCH